MIKLSLFMLAIFSVGLEAKKEYYTIKPENFKSIHVC